MELADLLDELHERRHNPQVEARPGDQVHAETIAGAVNTGRALGAGPALLERERGDVEADPDIRIHVFERYSEIVQRIDAHLVERHLVVENVVERGADGQRTAWKR